ncbi:MAG: DUF3592 domain-containing protein [Synergistaceae bacterium]|nr:DUF3592 domain-containing protein [Synergistaceae bacterium]
MENSFVPLSVGTVFLIIGIFLWIRASGRRKSMTPLKAVITRIERRESMRNNLIVKNDEDEDETNVSYTVHIAYDYNGAKYERELGHYIVGMKEGKEVEIFINPDNPSDISSKGALLGPVILVVMGAIILAVGVYLSK